MVWFLVVGVSLLCGCLGSVGGASAFLRDNGNSTIDVPAYITITGYTSRNCSVSDQATGVVLMGTCAFGTPCSENTISTLGLGFGADTTWYVSCSYTSYAPEPGYRYTSQLFTDASCVTPAFIQAVLGSYLQVGTETSLCATTHKPVNIATGDWNSYDMIGSSTTHTPSRLLISSIAIIVLGALYLS